MKTIRDSEFSSYKCQKYDIENMFSIYQDEKDRYFFNLNETLYLKGIDEIVVYYILTYPMFWSTVSYKIYQTTRLAWLLMKINNIDSRYMFSQIPSGTTIKIFPEDRLNDIADMLRR